MVRYLTRIVLEREGSTRSRVYGVDSKTTIKEKKGTQSTVNKDT